MKQTTHFRRFISATAMTLALGVFIPGMASAVPISLNGTVDAIGGFDGTPFTVGDSLTGAFNVDAGPDGSFNVNDLTDFSLAIGPVEFDNFPDTPSAIVFNGQLSSDGTTLTDFNLRSFFGSASNMDHAYALQFSSANQRFSATDTPFLARGSFAAIVDDGQSADVPAPSSFSLFGLAALALGFACQRRRRLIRSSRALKT